MIWRIIDTIITALTSLLTGSDRFAVDNSAEHHGDPVKKLYEHGGLFAPIWTSHSLQQIQQNILPHSDKFNPESSSKRDPDCARYFGQSAQ